MLRSFTLLFSMMMATFYGFNSNAQCISSFPYTQNFEKFVNFQTTASCDATVTGDTADGWKQDPSDGGDWRADTAGTTSVGTGPGATATTSGVGVGKDYNPGTTKGVYLYTEASSATSCANAEINLLSPCMDFSASGKYYRMKFAYHMFGGAMGSLHVDVYDGKNWTNDVWKVSGNQGTSWNLTTINLANFNSKFVQLRIRAVMGSGFASDCAIDAVTVESFTPFDYDGMITSLSMTPEEYYYVPLRHVSPLTFSGKVKNEGLKSITGTKLKYEGVSGKDSVSIGTIGSFGVDSALFKTTYTPSSLADSSIQFEVTLNEKDGDYSDNKAVLKTHVTKGLYSRDNGDFSGGVGFATGVGEIGQMFEFKAADTLASVTFFLNTLVAGDSVKVKLYNFNTSVGSLIATTKYVVTTGTAQWYTINFDCPQILSKGNYFVAIQQLVSGSNMSVGYHFERYTQNTAYYFGGATWQELGAGGIAACLLIRLSLAPIKFPDVAITSADTVCQGEITLAKGSGAATYQWSPSGIVTSPTSSSTNFGANDNFTLSLTGTNACGYSTTVSKDIVVKKLPSAIVTKDTTICKGQNVILATNTKNKYTWVGGPSNTSYTVKPTTSTTYRVDVDSTNGCKKPYFVNVNLSIPVPVVNNDTTICQLQPFTLTASGGVSYQWLNGPSTSNYRIQPNSTATYKVMVTDKVGCSESDSVKVSVLPGPAIKASNDTTVCFGQTVQLKASGAQSYEWVGGPKTANYNTFPLITKYYYVIGAGANGCKLTDSVMVEVADIPTVDLRNDTTICEGNSLSLIAKTSDKVAFYWDTKDTTKSITIAPTVKTKYRVVVANSAGCAAADSVIIDVKPLPVLKLSYVLNKRDVTFTNTSVNGKTYDWDFGDNETSNGKNEFHKYAKDGDYVVKFKVINDCGSKDTSFTIKIENLGIGEMKYSQFSMNPNPSKGILNVKFTNADYGMIKVNLVDLTGKKVLTFNQQKYSDQFETTFSIAELPNGLYYLQIEGVSGNLTRKVVLSK